MPLSIRGLLQLDRMVIQEQSVEGEIALLQDDVLTSSCPVEVTMRCLYYNLGLPYSGGHFISIRKSVSRTTPSITYSFA